MLRFTHAQFRLTEFHAMLPARDIQTMQYRDSECDPPAISCMCWSCTDADADARCSDLPVKKINGLSSRDTHTQGGVRLRADLFRAKRFRAMMHRGTFPRAAIRARKRTFVHHRAETLRADKIGFLSAVNLHPHTPCRRLPPPVTPAHFSALCE